MRLLITLIGAVFALVVGLVIMLPYILPAENIRREVTAQIERATGYRVEIGDEFSFIGFPTPDLAVTDVRIQGGEVFQSIRAGRMEVGFDFWPLLSGDVILSDILLVSPTLTLVQSAESSLPPPSDVELGEEPDSAEWLDQAERVKLNTISVEGGTVRFVSPEGQERDRISAIAIDVEMQGISSPLQGSVSFERGGKAYSASLSMETLRRIIEGGVADFTATISAPAHLAGDVKIAASIERTAQILTLGDVAVTGPGLDFEGAFEVALVGTPKITGNLAGPLLSTTAISGSGADSGLPLGGSEGEDANPPTIVDLSPLDAIDADITVSIDRLEAANYVVAPFVGRLTSEGRTASVFVDVAGFADGTLGGNVNLDGTGQEPYLSGSIQARDLNAASIAEMGGSPFPVTGDAGASIQFATAGTTLEAWGARANAAGNVFLSNASVSGLGLASAVNDPAADTMTALGVVVEFQSLTDPIAINGGATWRGERLELAGTLDGATLVEGGAAPVDLGLSSGQARVGYKGSMSRAGRLDGVVSLDTPSLRGLLAWLGRPIAPGPGLEQFSFSGGLGLQPGAVAFSNATIALDNTRGTGSGSVQYGGKPTIEANLALEALDLTTYLPANSGSSGNGTGNTASAAPWSTAPIDLTPLNAANVDLSISTQSLRHRDLTLGPTSLAVVLSNGALNANLSEMQLYGGSGSGTFALATGELPRLAMDFTLRGLNAEPFLTDAIGFRRLTGNAGVTMDISGTGRSQAEIVRSLAGALRFQFANGVIKGVDLPALVKTLTGQILAGWNVTAGDQTEFNQFQASFAIENGIAQTDDLSLDGPLIAATGSGTVNLTEKSLNLSVSPSIKAGLPSTQGQVQLLGLGVPVKIVGPWGNPRIYPDIEGILTNPQAALTQLQTLGGGVFELLGNTGQTAVNLPTQIIEAPTAAVGDVVEQVTGIPVGDAVRSITSGTRDVGGVAGQVLQGVGGLLRGQAPGSQDQQSASADPNAPTDLTSSSAVGSTSDNGVPLPLPRPSGIAATARQATPQQNNAPQQLQPETQPQQQEVRPEEVLEGLGRDVLRGILGSGN